MFEIPAIVPGEYSLLAFSINDGKAHSTQEDLTVGNADVEGLTVILLRKQWRIQPPSKEERGGPVGLFRQQGS
jgi:hypothetical protein